MITRTPLVPCLLAALALVSTVRADDVESTIDRAVSEALTREKIKPAAVADDATILRRLTLDLAGRIPTATELDEYLASTDSDKKVKLVTRLMDSPGFVRHNTQEFVTLLQASKKGKGGLDGYLAASLKENLGWDKIFKNVMLPDDADPKQAGAGEFLKSRVKELDRLTIDVSSIFFGVNVSCAQCHDHPHVPTWTQDHFYGMKSFFARSVEMGTFVGEKSFGVVKYVPNKGKEKVSPVMFLTGKTLEVPGMAEPSGDEKKKEQARLDMAKKSKTQPEPPSFSLRAKLVETALSPEGGGYFSRSIVNRMFARFLGRGLVMPLDQMHLENPASHPELLNALAKDLETNNYDLRRLIRGIVLSDTYARASRTDGDLPDEKWFAVAQSRPLTPGQMSASLKVATLNPKNAKPDESSFDRFTRFFPQPGTNFQVSVSEAMAFANNESLAKDLLEGTDDLVAALQKEPDLAKRAEMAVRSTLNRPARPEEIAALVRYQESRSERPRDACQQIVWALLTTAEFRFNH